MSGTGLFAVDGIDIAQLVADNLGPRVLDAVLYKPGAPAARDPANPTQAPAPGEPVPYPCKGFTEDFSTFSVDGTLIKAGDRKVILLGGTLNGVEPEGADIDAGVNRDQVLIEGTRYNIHRVLSRDPAGATFTLQVRT